jgi:chemotaxis protein histidine kinase CheA
MTEFRRQFLADSINNLKVLQTALEKDLTEEVRREAFRAIHTIKGGAQMFGLENAAQIAGRLENFLVNIGPSTDRHLLVEGIERLGNTLRENPAEDPAGFLEKLQNGRQISDKSDVLLTGIPPQIFNTFSPQEQNTTISALRAGNNIYCAEVGFEATNFADEYRSLRKILCEKSLIIATLPSEKYNSAGKLGFRIFLASREPVENLQSLVKNFTAEISSHACADQVSNELFTMLSQIAAHAEEIARKSAKEIRVTILASDLKLSAALTGTVFEILLHLVRNAADHAIERRGAIDIRLFDEGENLYLSVADDGCGIDPEKVRRRALEKNLISDDDFPDEHQTLELIFVPELSTAEEVT